MAARRKKVDFKKMTQFLTAIAISLISAEVVENFRDTDPQSDLLSRSQTALLSITIIPIVAVLAVAALLFWLASMLNFIK